MRSLKYLGLSVGTLVLILGFNNCSKMQFADANPEILLRDLSDDNLNEILPPGNGDGLPADRGPTTGEGPNNRSEETADNEDNMTESSPEDGVDSDNPEDGTESSTPEDEVVFSEQDEVIIVDTKEEEENSEDKEVSSPEVEDKEVSSDKEPDEHSRVENKHEKSQRCEDLKNRKKVIICHVPGGDHSKAKTLVLGRAGLNGHNINSRICRRKNRHVEDYLGACKGEEMSYSCDDEDDEREEDKESNEDEDE